MGNIWKRLLSLTLAMVMVLGMVPVQAFAAEDAGETAAVVAETEAATPETPVAESSEPVPETTAAPETTVAPETTEAPAGEPEEDAAVKSVQALIDALPTAVNSAEEAEALNAALAVVNDAIAGLTGDQAAQLDMGKYYTATTALESWYNQDYSGDVLADGTKRVLDGEVTIADLLAVVAWKSQTGRTYTWTKPDETTFTSNKSGLGADCGDSSTIEVTTGSYKVQYTSLGKTYSKTIDVTVYHKVTAQLSADSDANATGAGVTPASAEVDHGNTATITVAKVDGYKAEVYLAGALVTTLSDENWTYTTPAVTASCGYTVKYVSTSAAEYDVELVVEGEEYGKVKQSKEKGISGDKIALTITPEKDTESVHYNYKVEVSGEGASYNETEGVVVIGTEDVTVTVTFEKYELTLAENAESVKFNGYLSAKEQMAGGTGYADVETRKVLEQVILDALGVQFNGEDVEVADVSIQYWPYAYGALFGASVADFNEDSERALGENAPDDTWSDTFKSGLKYYDFGQRFREGDTDAKEKIVITYTLEDGTTLSLTREITLTEGRKVRDVNYTVGDSYENPLAYENKDTVLEEIKKKVSLQGRNWDGLTISVSALPNESGATQKVTVTVTGDTGDATYVPTTSFDLFVQSPAAVATVNFDVQGSGTVKVGELDKSGTLTPGKYAITATATSSNDKSIVNYLESVVVTCGENAVTPDGDGMYALEGDKIYTVNVEFKTASVVLKENQTLSVNRYSYDTKIQDLKNNVLSTVMEGYTSESAGDYTVTLKGVFGAFIQFNLDEVGGYNDTQKARLETALGEDTLTVTVTGKHGETASVSVTLAEARKAYEIQWEDPTVDFDSQADIDAAVMNQLKAMNTDCGTITATLAEGQKLPGTEGAELTYHVTVAENEKYLETTGTVEITAKANSKPTQLLVQTAGEGTGEHTIPTSAYETVNFTVTPNQDGSYVESVMVTCGGSTNNVELSYSNTVASGSFSVENDKSYTVTITYGKATLEVAQDAEVALNLYVGNYVDYSARLDGLKGKLLNALLGENVNADDYEVYVYTTKLSFLGTDGYKSVEALDFYLYASQIKDTIQVKIVKKASADGKLPAVTVEDISVQVVESRQTASIDVAAVNEITVTDSLNPVITAVKAATTTNGGTMTAEITNGELPTPEKTNGTVTVKVTVAESKDALENTTGVTVNVAVKLAQYTLTWNAGEGAFTGGGKTITTEQYYGETVTKPESEPSREQTVSHTYTFDGWDGLTENATVTGETAFTAKYQEELR